jgi:hypothetical protein
MNRLNISVLLLLFFTAFSHAQEKKDIFAEKYANTITSEDLSRHLHILASDSMEGRETGYKGQKMAAEYLASQFKKDGLAPIVKSGNGMDYFQKFDLVKKEWQEVSLNVGGKKKEWLKDYYAFGDISTPQEEKMKVVFAGYGIDSQNYSDYKNLDVKNKAVIISMGEPVINGISAVSGDSIYSDWANDWRRKAGAARAQGAKHVFIIVGRNQEEFDKRLNQVKPHIGAPTLGFTYKQRPGSAFFIPIAMAAEMLGTSEKNLAAYLELKSLNNFKGSKEKVKVKMKPAKLLITVQVKETKLTTENVLGFIEGTDKKDEVLVLTAHYDHIGKEGNKIFYGADDDGSGTVALLELAEAFGKAKQEGHGPRRSILIMPVTGEEKGLMGSEYYTDHPVFPLLNTVADLNIDMIGRLDNDHLNNPNYVYLIGSDKLSMDLHKISELANKTYSNIELDYKFNRTDDPNRFYYRSDHYNFAKNNIPVIFYFNGVHADYHQPTDTVDKILFDKIAKITKLVFYTAWDIANREERLVVNVK